MSTSVTPPAVSVNLPYEPRPSFRPYADPALADSQGKRIGILVVTYNAISTLVPVLKRIPPEVWKNVEEVAVFDDASRDATFELAVGLKTVCELSKLHVLRHQKNLGYGGNQKSGYRYFLEKGFDVVILLHGDGQYAPEIMASLYHPLVTGEADAVFGSRMMTDYGGPLKGGMPLYKYVGNRILTTLENRALGTGLTEFHSGYRAYSLHALKELDFSRMTDDFHFDTEIIIKLFHQRFRIKEVPIPTFYGKELCYVDGVKYAINVMRAVRRYRQTCQSVMRAPEFAEYFIHYPVKQMRHSSHNRAVRWLGANQEVLDVGCGNGIFAAELKKRGNRVTGIDCLDEPSEREALESYTKADLSEPNVLAKHVRGRFDWVLLLDVLEHLALPERLLMESKAALKDSGRLMVSVPNIANVTTRLSLLFGCFSYTERGILDRTHLRFFTRKTARRLLHDHGFEIVEEKMTNMPLELVLGLAPGNFLMRAANTLLAIATKVLPGFLGYQIMFVARPVPADEPGRGARSRSVER